MSCLDEANRFLYTTDDDRYTSCERAIGQVTHLLGRLSTVWKVRPLTFSLVRVLMCDDQPVMTSTAYFASLGLLVNVVLHRVLTEIEDQVDISEEESIRLNKLCKILHGLEDLFIDQNGNVRPGLLRFVNLADFCWLAVLGRTRGTDLVQIRLPLRAARGVNGQSSLTPLENDR